MKPKAIILRAAGTNCQYETEFVLAKSGFDAETVHLNELIRGIKELSDYDFLAIPGGFSYGDYLGAGKVFANKISFNLGEEIKQFVEHEKLVIGICNGFQVLVKTGLLPGFSAERKQECTLALNNSGNFQCEWINMKAPESNCIFTKDIASLDAPIAHGEGKFYADKTIVDRIFDNKQIAFTYTNNPNGSIKDIAGICDQSGKILGMMPHPERNNSVLNEPTGKAELSQGKGMKLFENAYNFFKH